MSPATDLRAEWHKRARSTPWHPVMDLTKDGLVLGVATVLAERRSNAAGRPELVLVGAEERILALLAVAYDTAIGPRVLGNIRRASAAWGQGETTLALIHLARSGLPRLPDGEGAPFRLFAAECLLAAGMAPRELLKGCGLDTGPLDLLRAGYNPDEPRVPAGNPGGGQWTDAGGEPKAPAPRRPRGRFAPANPAPTNYTPVKYRVVHSTPKDAVVVKSPDGKPIIAGDPPTTLIAPPHANFHTMYAAGQSIASLPLSSQIPRIYAALHQGGTYDFQRDPVHLKFFKVYTKVSNYGVGVYMAGAGYSLWKTLAIAETYALYNSSNYNKQRDWITRGWEDATAG